MLSAVRLLRRFGALTFIGLFGAVLALLTFGSSLSDVNAVMMICGIQYFVFAGLLLTKTNFFVNFFLKPNAVQVRSNSDITENNTSKKYYYVDMLRCNCVCIFKKAGDLL